MNTVADNGGYYNRFISAVNDKQREAIKFEPLPSIRVTNENTSAHHLDNKGVIIENTNHIKPNVLIDNAGNTMPVRGSQSIRGTETNPDVYQHPKIIGTENSGNGTIRDNTYHQNNNNNSYQQPTLNTETKPTRNQYQTQTIDTKPTYQEPARNNTFERNNSYTPSNNGGGGGGGSRSGGGGGGGGGGRPR